MATSQRIVSLTEKHRNLDRILHDEQTRPFPDEARIKEIKRRKLALKDQLASLDHSGAIRSATETFAGSDPGRR